MKSIALVTSTLIVVALSMGLAPGEAVAHSNSQTVRFDNGATLTSNIWMQTLSDWRGCGDFVTSATITQTPAWIKNVTSFHASGVSASLKGAGLNFNGPNASMSVTNNRGQLGAYISGRVCGNLTTVYIGGTVTGSALQYGSIRVASASI